MKSPAALLALAVFAGSALAADTDGLLAEFRQPPRESMPYVRWRWLNGNIHTDAIVKDLEAMQRAGIGGAFVIDQAQVPFVKGPTPAFGEEWMRAFGVATTTAQRLGLQLSPHNVSGITAAGGPWVTPEQSMQMLTYSISRVEGPGRRELRLPPPPRQSEREKEGYLRDFAVLAFPTPEGDGRSIWDFDARITSNIPKLDVKKLRRLPGAGVLLNASRDAENAPRIDIEVPPGWTPRTLSLWCDEGGVDVLGSSDGKDYQKITARPVFQRWHAVDWAAEIIALPQPVPRHLRLVFSGTARGKLYGLDLTSRPSLDNQDRKAGYLHGFELGEHTTPVPPDAVVSLAAVRDITDRMKADGSLDWEVPPGNWTVLRLAHTSTGARNSNSTPAAEGLEIDKFSAEAAEAYYQGLTRKFVNAAGPATGSGFKAIHIDSFEVGAQNWTRKMPEEFAALRGYDLKNWLPALAGFIVESPQATEKFLWDFRLTLSDLAADRYFGTFARLAHKDGVRLKAQPYGNIYGDLFDDLQAAKHLDIVEGEFWGTDARDRVSGMPSAAHVWNINVVSSEAFTDAEKGKPWTLHPALLKAGGDRMFALGYNRFELFGAPHKFWADNVVPGFFSLGHGSFFDRKNTITPYVGGFHAYLARCQHLLRQGLHVADICYLYSPGGFTRLDLRLPEIPVGYKYDAAPAERILTGMTVQDGFLALPHGTRYRLLLLPPDTRLTVPLLKKVKELLEAGAHVAGLKPTGTASLADGPSGDAEALKLADAIWGTTPLPPEGRAVGRGRIYTAWDAAALAELRKTEPKVYRQKTTVDPKLPAVLEAMRLSPDVEAPAPVQFNHRTVAGRELYFVCNPADKPLATKVRFRVNPTHAQLWRPDTGETEPLAVATTADGRAEVALAFEANDSAFIVFGADLPPATSRPLKPTGAKLAINGPWTLRFQENRGAPAQVTLDALKLWNDFEDFGIKHFSGVGTYTTQFDLPASALQPGRHHVLDLGDVQVVARVTINGRHLADLWKKPFRADVTDALRPGTNQLEIQVVNLWRNRVIGDESLPETPGLDWLTNPDGTRVLAKYPDWLRTGQLPADMQRITLSNWRPAKTDKQLLPSGLKGPVTLVESAEITP